VIPERRSSGPRHWAPLIIVPALLFAAPAAAKEFGPRDLKVCGRSGCVPIRDVHALSAFSMFTYGDGKVTAVAAPAAGTGSFAIRFRDGSLVGVVATHRLDRFRANGINCGRFHRGIWYRLPARITKELQALTSQLRPAKLSASIRRSC
jgi:hypothetical protein